MSAKTNKAMVFMFKSVSPQAFRIIKEASALFERTCMFKLFLILQYKNWVIDESKNFIRTVFLVRQFVGFLFRICLSQLFLVYQK